MQTCALPVQREHVWVHLPDLPDEHRPLAGGHQAFSVPKNKDQTLPAGSPVGGLDVGIRPVHTNAFLPQVRPKVSLFLFFFSQFTKEKLTSCPMVCWPVKKTVTCHGTPQK